MINHKYFILLIIFFLLSLLSCNEQKQQDIAIKKQDSVVYNQTFSEGIDKTQKIESVVSESSKKNIDSDLKALSPKELEKALPAQINGTEKLPSNNGHRNVGGLITTSVSSEYIFPKGAIIIRINDYIKLSNIPVDELKFFKKYPIESGSETEIVTTEFGNGYSVWDGLLRKGYLKILVSDRFIVEINVTNIPKTMHVTDYVKLIKFNKLKSK